MLAEHISKLEGEDLLILTEPDTLDWTSNGGKVCFITSKVRIDCPLPSKLEELQSLFQGLQHYIGDRDDVTVYFWNLKNFMSYAYCKLGMKFEFQGTTLDLKIAENFAGLSGLKVPKSLVEAKNRLLAVMNSGNWEQFINVYRKIFLPLATDVLPHIESIPLADQRIRKLVYSSYVIEDSINGRLKTRKTLKRSYIPHSMGPEDRENLCPKEYGDHFIYADFKNMEVSVLQWLSKDDRLGEILNSDLDAYSQIWKRITGNEPDEEQRESCKRAFLAVVYGAGAKRAGEAIHADLAMGEWFIDQMERNFPKTMRWVRDQMDQDGVFIDVFGRRIKLIPGKEYKLQNYAVSAPAAMICLQKLIELKERLVGARLAFSIHDGFGILSDKYNVKSTIKLATKILESEIEMCPGLRLKVACTAGERLNSLQPL